MNNRKHSILLVNSNPLEIFESSNTIIIKHITLELCIIISDFMLNLGLTYRHMSKWPNQHLMWLSFQLQRLPRITLIVGFLHGIISVMCLQWKNEIKRFLPNSSTVTTWLDFPKSHVKSLRSWHSLAASGVPNSITAVVGEVIVTYLTWSN